VLSRYLGGESSWAIRRAPRASSEISEASTPKVMRFRPGLLGYPWGIRIRNTTGFEIGCLMETRHPIDVCNFEGSDYITPCMPATP
jgi:hypothetical protein